MALSRINANSITDDSITVDQIADTAVHGRRNIIINGAMQIAQRGTVTGLTASNYGGPDRIRLGLSGAGTHSVSQSTTVPSGAGFSNSWKLDCTTADTTPAFLAAQYRVEGQDLQQLKKGTSSAESVTVSFWVRSNVTGTYVFELRDVDNTRHIAKTYTISAADTFEYKTLTFAGDTSGTLDNDDGNSIELNWWLGANSTYTSGTLASSWAALTDANRAAGLNVNIAGDTANEWLITGVQLEVGDKATPFEHRSFPDELLRCQRYCVVARAVNTDTSNPGAIHCNGQRGHFGFGLAHNSTNPVTYFELPVAMRNRPGVSFSATNDFGFDRGWAGMKTYTNAQVQGLRSSTKSVAIIGTTSGLTNGQAGSLSADPDETNAKITFNAEL